MDEKNLKIFKKWLRGILNVGPTTIIFIKKDGSKRTMNCTLQRNLIPQTVSEGAKKERKINEEVLAVYDLEQKAWKSFRWDSLKEVIVTI